jgi:site-specific DNA-cytosine methylase
MSDQLQMFEEQTSHASTLSPLEVLAKTSALLESVKEWMETDQALSLKQFASLGNADQEYLSGKMLKELSAATLAKTLRQSSKRLPTLGAIDLNGNCLIHRGFYPKIESAYTLSDILQSPKRNWRGVFPIEVESGKNYGVSGQQANTNTILQRYGNDAQGSYIIERKLDAQVKQVGTRLDSNGGTQPNSDTRRGRVGKQKAQTLETSCNQGVIEPIFTYEAANETVRRNTFIEGEIKALDFYNKAVRDESPTLTDPKHNSVGLFDGYRIRRLTPIECERLQGFPDDHTSFGNYDGEVKPMSRNQRYKQCGNAVTVDVVQAVAEQVKPLFK